MSAIDVRFVGGLAIAPETGAERRLQAAHPAFAAAWAAVLSVAPQATLTPLFASESEVQAAEIQDLTDAARMTGADPPDLLRWFWLECPDDLVDAVRPFVAALPFVDWSGPRPLVVPASVRDGNVSWGTNPHAQDAFQVRRAPRGVDAIHAWRIDGGTGAGVAIADIENGWYLDHEELLTARITRHSVFGEASERDRKHGTSTVGVIAAADNGVGLVGIAPDARVVLVTQRRAHGLVSLAEAIKGAARAVGVGGVVLVEGAIHLGPLPPAGKPISGDLLVEADPANHAAIRYATETLKVTVIEPAGNGFTDELQLDLDQPPPVPPGTTAPVDMKLPTASLSGAIVVGAGAHTVGDPTDWFVADFSVRGARVDCFAAGERVYAPIGPEPSAYEFFSGTSSASAIIAGVVASIQGMSREASGVVLGPQEVRNLVRDRSLGTRIPQGFGGIGPMPDLRRIARSRGWARILPVAAAWEAGEVVIASLTDEDRLERRHWTSSEGWSAPLTPPADDFDLWPVQPTLLSRAEAGQGAVWLALATDPFGIHQLRWTRSGMTSRFYPHILLSRRGTGAASSSAIAAVRIADAVALVAVGKDGHLLVMTGDPAHLESGLEGPVVLDAVAQYRRCDGVAAVATGDGTADVVAIEDGGSLNWYRRQSLPGVAGFWSASVVDPTWTALVPGARPAALAVGGQVLAAAVGVQGWLTTFDIDPAVGTVPAAFSPPVVVDTKVTLATRGPLALVRLKTPDDDRVIVFGIDTESNLRFATRAATGEDWSSFRVISSTRRVSPLGGVTAISSPELGIFVFAVAVDGTVLTGHSRTGSIWSQLHALLEEEPPTPIDPNALTSKAFKDNPLLQAVAADKDRISRLRNARTEAVGKVQRALLLWDPACLPKHHDDGKYGDETAGAVARFKKDVLIVPPTHIVDDVGPATVLRLDKIQAAREG